MFMLYTLAYDKLYNTHCTQLFLNLNCTGSLLKVVHCNFCSEENQTKRILELRI